MGIARHLTIALRAKRRAEIRSQIERLATLDFERVCTSYDRERDPGSKAAASSNIELDRIPAVGKIRSGYAICPHKMVLVAYIRDRPSNKNATVAILESKLLWLNR